MDPDQMRWLHILRHPASIERLPFKVKSLTLIPYGNYRESRDFVPR